MEELQTDTSEQTLTNPFEKKPVKFGLNKIANILSLLAIFAVWAMAIALFIVIISPVTSSDGVNNLFGHKEDVLGLLTITGVLFYILLIGIALVAIVFATIVTKLANKYRRITKNYAQYDSAVRGLGTPAVVALICLFAATFIVGLGLIAVVLSLGATTLTAILGYTAIGLIGLAFVLAVIDYIICKASFNKLSPTQQEELKAQAKQVKVDVKKKEKRKRVGKLY